jgi:hypothetical protein
MSQNYSREYSTEKYGDETETGHAWASQPMRYEPPPPVSNDAHHAAARGLGQMLVLHPAPAFFAIMADAMVSVVDMATLEITAPVLWLIASIFTGVVVFMAQKKWGGDDQESAFIKALMVAFLVALPTPFPAFLTVPSAIAGTVQILRRRS